ncbi:oxalate:formate antiporter [uncultured Oxalicibacterium sp.]|uniref:MFS transporter small subunit n=1 Tax=uncultured Oxalicibacterium sp. TaxID=1168540 RepID=UPI0025D65C24|nr:oxalate:formate antiporter [uncultured Oxalicibacterium sp.]
MTTAVMQHDAAHHHDVAEESHHRTSPVTVLLFWLFVGVPLAWGIWSTLQKAMALFH